MPLIRAKLKKSDGQTNKYRVAAYKKNIYYVINKEKNLILDMDRAYIRFGLEYRDAMLIVLKLIFLRIVILKINMDPSFKF